MQCWYLADLRFNGADMGRGPPDEGPLIHVRGNFRVMEPGLPPQSFFRKERIVFRISAGTSTTLLLADSLSRMSPFTYSWPMR